MPSKKRGSSNYKYRSKANALKRAARRDKADCYLCGGKLGPIDYDAKDANPLSFTADHEVAIANGGNEKTERLFPAHRSCNSKRQAMSLDEWFESQEVKESQKVKPSLEGL